MKLSDFFYDLQQELIAQDPLEKRSRYRKYKFSLVDFISLFIVIIFFALFLTLFILDKTYKPLDIFKDIINLDIGF